MTIIEKVYSFLWGDMIRIPLPGGSGWGILFYARKNVAYLFGDTCWHTAYSILTIMLFSSGIAAYTFVWDMEMWELDDDLFLHYFSVSFVRTGIERIERI